MKRRTVLSLFASATALAASGIALAKEKEKKHFSGDSLLGPKIKANGKHKIHQAGKHDVFADVNNGKVVGVTATGMQVKKVKSRQKFAEAAPGIIHAGMDLAQTEVYYYGFWVYDADYDYYYWFPTEVVFVDTSWFLI